MHAALSLLSNNSEDIILIVKVERSSELSFGSRAKTAQIVVDEFLRRIQCGKS